MTMQTEASHETIPEEPTNHHISEVRTPWRRFFARSMDLFIYNAIWGLFLTFVMNANVSLRSQGESILDTLVAFGLMLLLEPLMLALFGTTPGKWILGLKVEDHDGRYLYYTEAFSRTWMVFLRGFGLNIPLYNIYRQWKSYSACKDGETLDWEHDSVLILVDEKRRRTVVYIGVGVALFLALIGVLNFGAIPKHKGDITVAEFSENYNKLADYFDVKGSHKLDATGNWVMRETEGNTIVFYGSYRHPEFEFVEKNGVMTGMRFSLELENSDEMVPSYQNEKVLAMLAFVGAQKGYNPLTSPLNDAIKTMARMPFDSFHYEIHGITVICDISYSGYHEATGFDSLWPMENLKTSYKFDFEMGND